MVQTLVSLHPNPGWMQAQSRAQTSTGATNSDPTAPIGKHCILELYDCSHSKLDDETFLRSTISAAVQRAGATLLQLITHQFEPQGITGLALLAESHLSIHTWPESGYAAVDVFTCGDHTMPERACGVLIHELEAGHHSLRSFRRQTPLAIAHEEPWVGG
ncbi:MAG: adenosylmethionine decarboxylase [Vulcanococcus sp.]